MRSRISHFFSRQPSAYKPLKNDDSASGSDSPRKTRSSEAQADVTEVVDLSQVFTPKGKLHPKVPRAPRRLKEANPQNAIGRPSARAALPPAAQALVKVHFLSENDMRRLMKDPGFSDAIGSATVLQTVTDFSGQIHLRIDDETAFKVFAALVSYRPALALRFFTLVSSHLSNMRLHREDDMRQLLEHLPVDEPDSGFDLATACHALVTDAKDFVRTSQSRGEPVGLAGVLTACPSWALRDVLTSILAVDSNPDPVKGSKSVIDAWCKQDQDFANALLDAKQRLKATGR